MYGIISQSVAGHTVILIGLIFGLLATYLLLRFPPAFLPKDHGRAFAVNGALSKGKIRGVGLILVAVFLICGLLFLPLSREYEIDGALLFLMMLSGYLDDASRNPWSDYKKGTIDLIISILAVANYLLNNPGEVYFFSYHFTLHPVVYGILGIVLIWASVNVTNCSDGVDGLCGSVSVVALLSYAMIFYREMGETYTASAVLMAATLLAYLRFNWSPSTQLMGDAGSRSIGIWLAILAMRSRHPFSFLLICLVFILDGGLGLVKVFIMRFFKIPFLKNIRFPLHDQLRKNLGWKDVPVVLFMLGCQIFMSVLTGILVYLSRV